jgi:hypothetical protein
MHTISITRAALRRHQQPSDNHQRASVYDSDAEISKSDLDIQLSSLLTISTLVLGVGMTMISSVDRTEMQSALAIDSERHTSTMPTG